MLYRSDVDMYELKTALFTNRTFAGKSNGADALCSPSLNWPLSDGRAERPAQIIVRRRCAAGYSGRFGAEMELSPPNIPYVICVVSGCNLPPQWIESSTRQNLPAPERRLLWAKPEASGSANN